MLPLLGIARGKGLCYRCEVLPIVQVYVTIVRYCPEYRSMLPLLGIAHSTGLCCHHGSVSKEWKPGFITGN